MADANFGICYDGEGNIVPCGDSGDTSNGGGTSYDIPTGGTNTGGGLGDILKANSDSLVNALKETSQSQINQIKEDGKNLVSAITSGSILKRMAMNRISSEMSKHGVNSKDYMDLKAEHLDHAKNGSENLKNSDGEKIIPRDENAKHNSEKAIETRNMNKTDFGKIATGIVDSIMDTNDIDIDIMSEVIGMLTDNIDATKIDNNIGDLNEQSN